MLKHTPFRVPIYGFSCCFQWTGTQGELLSLEKRCKCLTEGLEFYRIALCEIASQVGPLKHLIYGSSPSSQDRTQNSFTQHKNKLLSLDQFLPSRKHVKMAKFNQQTNMHELETTDPKATPAPSLNEDERLLVRWL